MFGIGSQELFIIFLVVLLLFGADKIPEVARAIGKSIREFKKAANEIETELQQVSREKNVLVGKEEPRPRRGKAEPQGPGARRREGGGDVSGSQRLQQSPEGGSGEDAGGVSGSASEKNGPDGKPSDAKSS